MQKAVSTLITLFEANGVETHIDADALKARLEASRLSLAVPFAADRVDLVADVGATILKRKGPISPFVKHFGFWIRNTALQRLALDHARRLPPQTLSRPRGLVFHLPPKNVETVFLYSWVLSYLAGNANVVRLPQDISPDMRWICDLFLSALRETEDNSQALIHYSSDSDLGRTISAQSDARVVWGGDEKISVFETLPLRNGGKSIWFGDRFSLGVLAGATVAALSDIERQDLANRLFNDIFIFDQMACSSPHVLYVVGNRPEYIAGVKQLLQALADVATRRGEAPAAGHQIAKMVQGFSSAAAGAASEVIWQNSALTSAISTTHDRLEKRVGGGFLNVVFISSLDAIDDIIRERDQTVTHFGFDPGDIERIATNNTSLGVSRWTPAGTALDFDHIWDGYDLVAELTRLVRVT
jgi:hypothetical protein